MDSALHFYMHADHDPLDFEVERSSTMPPATRNHPKMMPNDPQQAPSSHFALARNIALLARINTSIEKLFLQNIPEDEHVFQIRGGMYDADSMLAGAEEDFRLGGILLEAVAGVVSVTTAIAAPPAVGMRGIAKKPRHISGFAINRHRRHRRDRCVAAAAAAAAVETRYMGKAAHVLGCVLQASFPLTWRKLLEDQ